MCVIPIAYGILLGDIYTVCALLWFGSPTKRV